MPNETRNDGSAAPVALVTGSSRGLGRGVALELARGGWSVAVHYSGNEQAARETSELCAQAAGATGAGTQAFPVFRCDLADSVQRERLVGEAFERFGDIDALVNNAGMGPRVRADILDASEASFDELVATNLKGPYFLTQAVARRWLASKAAPRAHGAPDGEGPARFKAVVFVTSISSETASIGRGEYCISKAGLSMAVKLWASRLAGDGIPVYELRPGIMQTDMTSGVKGKYDALIGQGIVPQNRWGFPSDLGKAVRSLLDGDFPFSTGAVIDVDGGFHISRL